MEINIEDLSEELYKICRNDYTLDERKVLEDLIPIWIDEKRVPQDFSCIYFELHQIYRFGLSKLEKYYEKERIKSTQKTKMDEIKNE